MNLTAASRKVDLSVLQVRQALLQVFLHHPLVLHELERAQGYGAGRPCPAGQTTPSCQRPPFPSGRSHLPATSPVGLRFGESRWPRGLGGAQPPLSCC